MSIVSTQRASYQQTPQIPGYGKRRKPKPVASHGEVDALNKAIIALNKAKSSTNEKDFLVHISEAFRIARLLFRGRQDL